MYLAGIFIVSPTSRDISSKNYKKKSNVSNRYFLNGRDLIELNSMYPLFKYSEVEIMINIVYSLPDILLILL